MLSLPEYSATTPDVIHCMDALRFLQMLPDNYVNCIVTSPPYFGLRDYGITGQIGLESSMNDFIQTMVRLFREARRVLRDDGTCWLNLGDSYVSTSNSRNDPKKHGDISKDYQYRLVTHELEAKQLCGIPWRVALALQNDGWWLRSDIIWHKPNPMPESVTDRPTKSHEYIFLLTKSPRYWYDADAIREENSAGSIERFGITDNGQTRKWNTDNNKRDGRTDGTKSNEGFRDYVPTGRNKRTVWSVATQPYSAAHFATYPMALIDPCIKAGCPPQVCVGCGAPWERVVEISYTNGGGGGGTGLSGTAEKMTRIMPERKTKHVQTIDWQPTCDCNAETRPGITLDMFMGAGTTALVAIQNNRHYIGSELNPEYVTMARQRIAEFDPFQPVERENGMKQLSLFG